MDVFLNSVGMAETELMDMIEPMRDPSIWRTDAEGVWHTTDSVMNHRRDPGVEAARLPLTDDNRPFVRTPEKIWARAQSDQNQKDYVLL
jgi:hypothetical protein